MAGIGTLMQEKHELVSSSVADLFQIPAYEQALIHGQTLSFFPHDAINNSGPIDIMIPSADNAFTYLPHTRLHMEIEVVKNDGTAMTATETNSVVNLFPHSLFKYMELYIKDTQINDLSPPTYPYKAMIEALLSYNKDFKDTYLSGCEFWVKETPGKEEDFTTTSDAFKKKRDRIAGKKLFCSIQLHIDFLHSARMLIPGVPLRLKLVRSDDKFSLLGSTKMCKVNIKSLQLDVRRVTCDPGVAEAIRLQLQQTPIIYPMVQSKIKTFLLNNSTKSQTISQIFNGKMPRSFIVGFVESDAVDGNIAKNPFLFKHFDLDYFQPFINGVGLLPQPLKPNITDGKYIREYAWFLQNIVCDMYRSVDVILQYFVANTFLLPFDLSPQLDNGFETRVTENGTVDFQLSFNTALAQNVTVIIYASFNEVLLIDKDKNVGWM